jgi:putative peptide zinc metalloprotease protein
MYLPAGQQAPTRDHPMLALVLVPHGGKGTPQPAEDVGADGAGATPSQPRTWVFPIDRPLAPGEGDNQALAVNTTDGTVDYDVAFALVWEDGEGTLDNTNEAYALASCKRCAAVAVAFQVVLVTGQAHVAVPQNVSVSVTSGCVGCLTYALAVQLFVTLDGPLSEPSMARLDRLWQEIMAFAGHLGDVPLDQIQARLSDYESRLLTIVEDDQGTGAGASASPSSTASSSPTVDASASALDDPSGSPSGPLDPGLADSTPPGTSSAGPSQTTSPSETSSGTPEPTPSASPIPPTATDDATAEGPAPGTP